MSDHRPGGAVEGADVVFRLADPGRELAGVRLWQERGLPHEVLDFAPVGDGWELRLPRPPVHRMEYLFEVRGADGHERTWTDHANPLVVDGVFGTHSVLELPGYATPRWVEHPAVESRVEPMVVPGTAVGDVHVQVWAPAGDPPTEVLPLLLAHDGPELSSYAWLDRYVAALVAGGALPRMRVALIAPGERDAWYSANPDHSFALVHRVLPTLRETYACAPDVVLLGASLGGLAALHAEWSHPGTFAGLCCQSGSFFTAETDPQEAGFVGFPTVTAFVRHVLTAATPPSTPYVTLTCGSAEENLPNNRVMAARLAELGCAVSYAESPDGHNFTAWRDVLDPHLTALLQRVWGR